MLSGDAALSNYVDAESLNRAAADTALSNYVSNVDSVSEAANLALSNYVSSVNDDSVFRDNSISNNLTTLINIETTNRINQITAEILARIQGDNDEEAARIAADLQLSTDVYDSMTSLSNTFGVHIPTH